MNRIVTIVLSIAVVAALALAAISYRSVYESQQARSATNDRILDRIAADIDEQAALTDEMKQPRFVEDGAGAMGSYLGKIRRDGLPAHAEMRQKLMSIARSNTSILTLLDLYEPDAQTAEFKKEARNFREYAIAWNDRWDSVMVYFMAGGNLPSSDVPFPTGFPAALQAEINAAK